MVVATVFYEDIFLFVVVASAGRSTPGNMPNAACAACSVAPVLPALNNAAALPSATRSAARRTDAPGFLRSADAGDSPMPMTSGASTTWMSIWVVS